MNVRLQITAGARVQRGVVLIVALVMLAIIALMSVSVMRASLASDLIVNNVRAQSLAQQSAELALRYCERQANADVQSGRAAFILPALDDDDGDPANGRPTRWNTFSNWFGGSAVAVTVPDAVVVSVDSPVKPPNPQCLPEYTVLNDGTTTIVLITARGFSPDHRQDVIGRTLAGSVVWLQSMLRFN
ncbi:pilus assembly PilX family protein [Ideonella oryzae]|uniref:Type 4 fimbrial biogenesis protein PilX N-terminal domain-containing protein n=1 Tax=Ideonella oryzae TaxID=2937441 RepID=A0ABT1BIA3_9BURK|nr:PilX N-terminal domain-containing pilus assembly protein [Ideonella oryzae]MCO5975945.1 hypothetical protein [Ideonella oryzae]